MLAMSAAAVSPALAAEIALRHYGLVGVAERLASEFDDTFRLVGADGPGWLLKISAEPASAAGGLAGPAWPGRTGSGFQTALLLHLAAVAPELPVQRVIMTVDGRAEIAVTARSTSGPGRRCPTGADDVVAGRAAARRRDLRAPGCGGTSAAPWPG